MFYAAASICPGLNFSDSGGQSKSVSLVQTQSRQQTSGSCISKLLYQAFHGGLSLCGQRFNRYICHAVPSCYSLLRFVTEPANITGSHNQCSGFFVGQPFDISQIINALFGGIFQRTNATGGQFECQITIYPFKVQQIVSRFVITEAFFWACAMVASAFSARSRSASTVGSSRPSISNSSFIGT